MKPAKKKTLKKSDKSKSLSIAPLKKKATSKKSIRVPRAGNSVIAKEKLSGTATIKKIETENLRLTRQLEQTNRQLEIEGALEKVRARTMAMQKSEELEDAANILFKQVKSLGIPVWSCGYNIWETGDKVCTGWMSSEGMLQPPFRIPLKGSPTFIHFVESREKGETFYVEEVGGKQLAAHYKYMLSLPDFAAIAEKHIKAGYPLPSFQINHVANFKQGNLIFITSAPVPQAHLVFKRFAIVFEQTYTRFLDLQKAEAQAREAQIEAALERVRSASLAMHHSNELQEVVATLFGRLVDLGLSFNGALIWTFDQQKRNIEMWVAANAIPQPVLVRLPYDEDFKDNAIVMDFWEAVKIGQDTINKIYSGGVKNEYFAYVAKYNNETVMPEQLRKLTLELDWTVSFAAEKNSLIGFDSWSGQLTSIENFQILKRFARVFEQAYVRFLDLQKSEAQAREAQIEASLERVRTQAMAMHKSDDLLNISKVLYEELKMLGIDEIRNAMLLIHDEKNDFFLDHDYSSIGGKITRIPTNGISLIEKYVKELQENEKSKVSFLELIVAGEELESWKKARKATGQLDDPRLDSMEVLYYYHYSIGKGNISISTFSTLSNEKLQVLERFRNVFQLPYQRYHDIEIAVAQSEQARLNLIQIQTEKKRAEDALTILKATQTQLIQSEKLASLGELTAGIAHEIQNPLNFVNNFSEVNSELIDELEQQVDNGNLDEVRVIAKDIKENEQKILHHGKRADAIVKGMLQHSRNSSGVKEPTDINALADEYLRLAYHGLRAKDKSFNATMKTDFDDTIGNINIIPQDIGRVILNLINNAFYAVSEKQKQNIQDYEPTIWVSTRGPGSPLGAGGSGVTLEISVKDNGNGIPQKALDKIFQPFFTTKPTGQGTGLGLSLSYDIVKAHGGNIQVNTKENEGTEFTITLPA